MDANLSMTVEEIVFWAEQKTIHCWVRGHDGKTCLCDRSWRNQLKGGEKRDVD